MSELPRGEFSDPRGVMGYVGEGFANLYPWCTRCGINIDYTYFKTPEDVLEYAEREAMLIAGRVVCEACMTDDEQRAAADRQIANAVPA